MALQAIRPWKNARPAPGSRGVAQAVRVGCLVFQPQQLERDVLALPLAVDLQPIRFRTSRSEFFFAALEQPLLQPKPIQILGQRPAQASPLGPLDVVLNGGRTEIDTLA